MPELPEVETARKVFQAHCLKKIIQVNAVEDEKVFEGIKASELSSGLVNQTPVKAHRLGKYLFIDFGPDLPALLLHFGMTGGTVVRGQGGAKFQRYAIEDSAQWPPKFCKLELRFSDGTEWAFCDSRRFARIRLLKNPLSIPPLSQLGWDPLLSWPEFAEFSQALAKQRRMIKAVLLDQSFSAGVGNWVADEVLYQARIHPEQPANSLTEAEQQNLHRLIREICKTASDLNADSERLPETWIFHQRWGKGSSTKSKIDGHTIDHITVGGRTSAYVPALQKLRRVAAAGGASGGKKQKQKVIEKSESPSSEEEVVELKVKKQRRSGKKGEAVEVEAPAAPAEVVRDKRRVTSASKAGDKVETKTALKKKASVAAKAAQKPAIAKLTRGGAAPLATKALI